MLVVELRNYSERQADREVEDTQLFVRREGELDGL